MWYKFNTKGKVASGIYLLTLLFIIVWSSSYIMGYKQASVDNNQPIEITSDDDISEDVSTVENSSADVETNEATAEATDEATEEAPDEAGNEATNEASTSSVDSKDMDSENATDDTSATAESEVTGNTKTAANQETTYSMDDLKILREAFIKLYYADQSFALSDANKSLLESFVKVIQLYPDEVVVIEGHADGFPNYSNNALEVALAMNRITSVKDYFLKHDVDMNQIILVNSGSTDPVTKESNGRDKNDRVEIYFIDHVIKNSNGK